MDDTQNKSKIEQSLNDKLIYDGRILSLHVFDIKLPNGTESIRECVFHKDGAGILTLDKDEFIFVKQFRYAIGREIIEIPAGLVEKGEDPKETAVRELQEEIGLKPLNIKHILNIYPSPGFTDEKTFIYYASEFKPNKLQADDDENIEIIRYSVEKTKELYLQGFFEDAKTVSALGYYFSEISK